jgi:hypothetical protein
MVVLGHIQRQATELLRTQEIFHESNHF